MKSNRKPSVPNHRLRMEREKRGWSHKDVADKIGVPDAQSIGRWERGEHVPQPHYRQLLCKLYGKTAVELGFVPSASAEDVNSDDVAEAENAVDGEKSVEESSARRNPLDSVWNIPAAFTKFIGRREEVKEVCSLLSEEEEDVRLVTLHGPGGIGKTRLALEVAQRLRDQFVNGVCFVSFAVVDDHDLFFSTIAQALRLEQKEHLSLFDQIKNALRDRHMLLLLDNCDRFDRKSITDLESLLSACPGIKMLVTSRVVLHSPAEYEFVVPSLSVPEPDSLQDGTLLLENWSRYDAFALFERCARAHVRTFRITPQKFPLLIDICQRLDGLPLAIELAAARMKTVSLAELLSQLQRSLQALSSPDHQQTLYQTIQWSYDLLPASVQWLFLRLALFVGPFTLADVHGLLSGFKDSPIDGEAGVTFLLDHSLLQRYDADDQEGTIRFAMLGTIREFGLELLRDSDEYVVCQRAYALYFLSLAEAVAPQLKSEQQTRGIDMLNRCKEELRQAFQWFVEQSKRESEIAARTPATANVHTLIELYSYALRFADACGKFYGLCGYWSEEWYWLNTVLEFTGTPDSITRIDDSSYWRLRARVLRRAGHLAYRLRHLEIAERWQREGVRLSRMELDLVNLAGSLSGLAMILYRLERDDEARSLLDEALSAARASGDCWSLANVLERKGYYTYRAGHYQEARDFLQESIACIRKTGDRESLARFLTTAVEIELKAGNSASASQLLEESQALAQELNARPLLALVLEGSITIALMQQDDVNAIALCNKRIEMARDLGDLPTVMRMELQLSKIALRQGNREGAYVYARHALPYFEEQKDYTNAREARATLAMIEEN